MKVSVLASGSSGNSTYVESQEAKILIDAGISGRRTINHLNELGVDISEIDGVFVTHEHIDHVRGIDRLHNKFDLPVYINRKTFLASNLTIEPNFISKQFINFKDIQIKAVSVSHDAADPVGYKIKNSKSTVGVFTDLGKPNQEIKNLVKESDCLVLESNHDIDMLLKSFYPFHLKQRILSERGHLSNIDAGLLVKEHSTDKLKTVFLAHLSKNNNTKELAMNTFSKLNQEKKLNKIITNDKELTELIKIS
jgi:phosphoribosyl 1,2-cyclic phosphodiesterase